MNEKFRVIDGNHLIKTYHQNGTVSELNYIIDGNDSFAIQCNTRNGHDEIYYPGDNLIRELHSELVDLSDAFVGVYFADLDLYYKESSNIPMGLFLGGQNSDISINKEVFLKLADQYSPYFNDLFRHLYVGDCQYLISTVQNLLLSAEYCFVQYYICLAQIDVWDFSLGETLMVSSRETMQLTFLLETFFTKLYSVLDLMVKIIYEFEHPVESFSAITKLKSAEKLWGNRKQLSINDSVGTIFEDCETIKQIESLRNEAVHNGTWEFRPKAFLRVQDEKIVERYMIFPDFDQGRLATVKSRRHFFSTETKVNDMLVLIHDEFYKRLLSTVQYINRNVEHRERQDVTP